MFDTVPDQQVYSLPDDFVLPVAVYRDGKVQGNSDPGEVANIASGRLRYWGDGLWWLDQGGLGLYPVPGSVQQVSLEYVFTPPPLVLPDDEPVAFPESFHPALVNYVAKVYYAMVEDNPELAQVNEEKYQQMVGELSRFRVSRETGGGSFTIGIAGVNA